MSGAMPAVSGDWIVARALEQFPRLAAISEPAWLVGGVVRDLVAGRTSRDADLALHGVARVARLFAERTRGRLVRLGEEPFDVLRVVVDGSIYDFAEIVGRTIEDDLARRDFTIGAIAVALEPPHAILDPFGGLRDLSLRIVRLVRESNLDDDPLRVLRGVRCAVELGFEVEAATMNAMRARAEAIGGVAPERVTAELETVLSTGDADRALRLLEEARLDRIVLPRESSGIRIPARLDLVTTLAILAGTIRGDGLAGYFQRWRWRASTAAAVASLLLLGDLLSAGPVDRDATTLALFDAGRKTAARAADLLRAKGRDDLAREIASILETDGERIFSVEALLDGREIATIIGIAPGPRIGAIKRALIVAQLRGEVTTREQAEAIVRNCWQVRASSDCRR